MPEKTPQEQIEQLEMELEQKKEAYARINESKESHVIAKEVLKEASEIPEHENAEADISGQVKFRGHVHALADEPHHKQIDELINIVEKDGILTALRIAKKLGDHLLDDFHDRLAADGYFPRPVKN